MKKGRGATMTHDYKRHGTTDLFAAMNVATGEVLHDTKARHSSKEVLDFFKFIDANVSKTSTSTWCSTTSPRTSPNRS